MVFNNSIFNIKKLFTILLSLIFILSITTVAADSLQDFNTVEYPLDLDDKYNGYSIRIIDTESSEDNLYYSEEYSNDMLIDNSSKPNGSNIECDIELSSNFNNSQSDLEFNNSNLNSTNNSGIDLEFNNSNLNSTNNSGIDSDSEDIIVDNESDMEYDVDSSFNSQDSTLKNSKYNNGIWLLPGYMSSLSFLTLSECGINHIFLHSSVLNTHSRSYLQSWINKAKRYGIRVHLWVQVFYNGN